MKKLILGTGLMFTLAFTTSCTVLNAKEITAEQPSQSTFNQAKAEQLQPIQSQLNQAELAQMLAPIALYPDSLLTHILIASTYPIEVVEAERWVAKNKTLSVAQLSKDIEAKDWEPSIKALAMFPKVLERLSDDLSWTQQLGDAFLQSEESVLQAIQDLRYKAEQAGNLDKMDNVEVTHENKNIIIQPAQKEVVYVPYYDTRQVYGNWHWSLYPPIFWDWGHNARYSHHRPFGWHSGIHISWNYFFSDFHWSNRRVVVINHRNTRNYRTKKQIVRGGYAKRWSHKPHHRRGVTYSNKQVNKRYGNHRQVVRKTVSKHHTGPKRNSNKKDYRQHKSINKKIVNRNTSSNKARNKVSNNNSRNKKLTKHEALQKKFNTRKVRATNKNVTRNASNKTAAKTNKRNISANKDSVRKSTNQTKTYRNKKADVRKNTTENNTVQRKTEKPVFKKSNKEAKKQNTVKTRSKPQRTERKEARRSQSSSNSNKQQRSKRHER